MNGCYRRQGGTTEVGWLAAVPESVVSHSKGDNFASIIPGFPRMIDKSHRLTNEGSPVRPCDPQINDAIQYAPVDLRCMIG